MVAQGMENLGSGIFDKSVALRDLPFGMVGVITVAHHCATIVVINVTLGSGNGYA